MIGDIYELKGDKTKSDEHFHKAKNIKLQSKITEQNVNQCSICAELLDFYEVTKTKCRHEFHLKCLNDWKVKSENGNKRCR